MYTSVMLLLCCSMASAIDWWVEDIDEAVEITRALETHWPDSDIHVLVGPVGTQGVWYEEGQLHLVDGDSSRVEVVSPDVLTQVLLVRSWTTELEPSDSGWLPEPRPDPVPRPELADTSPPILRVGLTGGPGLPWHGPPVRLAGEVGVRVRSLSASAVVLADLAEQLESADSPTWFGRRLGVGAQVGLYLPLPAGAIEPALATQTRFLHYADEAGDEVLSLVVPGATARLRWWGDSFQPGAVAVGIGIAVTVEGTVFLSDRVFRVGSSDTLYFEPVTAQLEFHVAREAGRS